ncbi:MAG: hypothetical protein R3F34_03850 [Planctomycetota bacterium]
MYGEIAFARIESVVHTDPMDAPGDVIELSEQHPGAVEANDFMRVFGWLVDAKKFDAAGLLANEYEKRFGEEEGLAAKMHARIKKAIDDGEISAEQPPELLKGMGYISEN